VWNGFASDNASRFISPKVGGIEDRQHFGAVPETIKSTGEKKRKNSREG